MRTEENGTGLAELKIETMKCGKATLTRFIVLLACLWLVAQAISAQISAGTKPIYSIEFKPGTNTTVVKGTVGPSETRGPDMTNEGREQYTLRARAGQHLRMEICSDSRQETKCFSRNVSS